MRHSDDYIRLSYVHGWLARTENWSGSLDMWGQMGSHLIPADRH